MSPTSSSRAHSQKPYTHILGSIPGRSTTTIARWSLRAERRWYGTHSSKVNPTAVSALGRAKKSPRSLHRRLRRSERSSSTTSNAASPTRIKGTSRSRVRFPSDGPLSIRSSMVERQVKDSWLAHSDARKSPSSLHRRLRRSDPSRTPNRSEPTRTVNGPKVPARWMSTPSTLGRTAVTPTRALCTRKCHSSLACPFAPSQHARRCPLVGRRS